LVPLPLRAREELVGVLVVDGPVRMRAADAVGSRRGPHRAGSGHRHLDDGWWARVHPAPRGGGHPGDRGAVTRPQARCPDPGGVGVWVFADEEDARGQPLPVAAGHPPLDRAHRDPVLGGLAEGEQAVLLGEQVVDP
jgi:hypothetical protein